MEELVEFLRTSEYKVGKREIANAFNIKGDDRIALKQMLHKLDEEGIIERHSRKDFGIRNELKSPAALQIIGTDGNGDLIARPEDAENGEKVPTIIITDDGNVIPKVGVGDMVLAKLSRQNADLYYAKVLKRISAVGGRLVAVYQSNANGEGILLPVDRQIKTRFTVGRRYGMNAKTGDIVIAEIYGDIRDNVRPAKVIKIAGNTDNPRFSTTIAIAKYGLPISFSGAVAAEVGALPSYNPADYTDMTDKTIVTVDGEDARDFDDAVAVVFDDDGTFTAYVAIADVAHYVRVRTHLDAAARERGNSVYFPDQAIHMLPVELASDLCSLREGEIRPTIMCEMRFSADGHKISHRFYRALIKSRARLTYTQVMHAFDGDYDDKTLPLKDDIAALHRSWQILRKASLDRGALLIDAPESKITLNAAGNVTGISKRERTAATEMIEELMIMANVAAAETLTDAEVPALFRVHESPSAEKLGYLYEFLGMFNVTVNPGKKVTPEDFNHIIRSSYDTPFYDIINDAVMRSQMKACYSTENRGHFGLALDSYVHFTSPIRRYADIVTARGLIRALHLGEGGLENAEIRSLDNVAVHVSATERQAEQAERDAEFRYVGLYMRDKVGKTFDAYIVSIVRFGLFVRLKSFGIDGFVPISGIGGGTFSYDSDKKTVIDYNSGIEYRLGDMVKVKLEEVLPLVGGLTFSVRE